MLTRKDLREATGLSRKALRIYEQRGIMSPVDISTAGPALFDENALELAQQVAVFRGAGLSLDVIERILSFGTGRDDTVISAVKTELHAMKSATDTALDLLDKLTTNSTAGVFETSFGGYWAFGVEDVVPLRQVCTRVRSRVEEFAARYGSQLPIAARYVENMPGKVSVRVFQKRPASNPIPDDAHRSYFVSQQHFAGLLVRGRHGDYDCFDHAYDQINEWRAERGRDLPSWSIEVYHRYHHISDDEDSFETLVLN